MWGPTRSLGRALVVSALLVSGFVVSLGQPASGAEGTPPPHAFVVVDAATGAVLTSRDLHEALPPASTAKIMTALVAVERLAPTALISVTPNAAGRECMCIGLKPGKSWPFDQTMASMMMVSANDAAYAVAETAGGSISGFAAQLNATARRYGMKDSTFGDPAGLDDATSYKGGPKVSAYDLAIATRNALTVPAIAQWAATRTYQFTDVAGAPHQLTNHDKFLPGSEYGYLGANGFKTGFTQRAGHTLVATANRGGRELIVVILGAVDSGYAWAASLLDQEFATPRDTKGTGIRLPPVAVSPYATRVAQQAGFVQLARGSRPALPPVTPTSAKPSSRLQSATATSSKATTHRGGGLLSLSHLLLVLVPVLFVAVVLRRRAVRRQRARRIARKRARTKAMRSGSLPIVDGRYRTGTRLGPPVESQVRVKRTRSYIDLTKDKPIRSTARGSARRRSR
jgi:D-alanyl-D-alanine carboxypeptidase (penicillin-binding protein 5/6)